MKNFTINVKKINIYVYLIAGVMNYPGASFAVLNLI